MTTSFITVLDDIITGCHTGDIKADFSKTPFNNHKRIEVADKAMFSIREGDKVTFYKKDWTRKSEEQLIVEGLIPIPPGYTLEDNKLRQLSQAERVIEGLDAVPTGYVLENKILRKMSREERIVSGLDGLPVGFKIEDNTVVEMTPKEKFAKGLITEEQYNGAIEVIVDPTYADLRREAYPPLNEQLDMIYHDQMNNTTVWQDTITEIKEKYPKEIVEN